jgi:DNA-binding beta-propeller fold protein YncE
MLCGTLACCALVSAQAAPSLEYVSTLSLPCEGSRIALPVSVTVGTDGIVCVTDATGNAGHLLDRGNVHLFSTERAAGLADPLDICVEASGGFVCTDSRTAGGRTIRKLDFFGQLLPFAPEPVTDLWTPERLLVTRDGNYVTTDPTNGYLAKHDAKTGALLWKRELKDSQSGELIALGRPGEAPDGRLLLPFPGLRQIQVLSAEGEHETEFGTPGGARGRLSFPVGVAFCPDGSIAVLDRMRHVILLYDEHFGFISEFGTFGKGPQDLYYPAAIASSSDGLIYVAQGLEGRIQQLRFTTTGSAEPNNDRFRPVVAGRTEREIRSGREGVVEAQPSP